jgi:hypothetical protein
MSDNQHIWSSKFANSFLEGFLHHINLNYLNFLDDHNNLLITNYY